MCDTLVIIRDGAVWFAKNSDREPDEPQVVEAHAPVRGDDAKAFRATYIHIPQMPDRYGTIISRPSWMWGAEMGVNDQGVAIGNEAVYSRLIEREGEALLGMDLLRLGLERGGSAEEALHVITSLLEAHGQAGPAGYRDKSFRYDNSYLIADGTAAWVLETAGRDWAAKRVEQHWAISNTYTIRDDYDRASAPITDGGTIDFKRRYEQFLWPKLARGQARIALSTRGISATAEAPMSLSALARILRSHTRGDGFEAGSNADVCMHAEGRLRPSRTTSSMIARLGPDAPPAVAFTGTPLPCISLFKPAAFSGDGNFLLAEDGLWKRGHELGARAGADAGFRMRLRASIAAAEPDILAGIEKDIGGAVGRAIGVDNTTSLAHADAAARHWLEAAEAL